MPLESEQEQMAAQVHDLARQIPRGRVTSYGALGARCEPPLSGYICGRLMTNVPDGVPWWRVVAKSGLLPIAKRNPTLVRRQRALLEDEGIEFDREGAIKPEYFI